MKIAVSSTGTDLGSPIDPQFGRCAYFLIVETDDMSFEACSNENIALTGCAGIQSAQFVSSKSANAVLTGTCGPNAVRTLSAASVEVFLGQTGTVREVIEAHKNGVLQPTNQANMHEHCGMGNTCQTAQASNQNFTRGRGMRVENVFLRTTLAILTIIIFPPFLHMLILSAFMIYILFILR